MTIFRVILFIARATFIITRGASNARRRLIGKLCASCHVSSLKALTEYQNRQQAIGTNFSTSRKACINIHIHSYCLLPGILQGPLLLLLSFVFLSFLLRRLYGISSYNEIFAKMMSYFLINASLDNVVSTEIDEWLTVMQRKERSTRILFK